MTSESHLTTENEHYPLTDPLRHSFQVAADAQAASSLAEAQAENAAPEAGAEHPGGAAARRAGDTVRDLKLPFPREILKLPTIDAGHLELIRPRDSTFWWAQSTLIESPRHLWRASFQQGAAMFLGGVYSGAQELGISADHPEEMWAHIGVIGQFGLDAGRRPRKGRYTSTPHADLRGTLQASSVERGALRRESLANGKLTLTQNVYQHGLRAPGNDDPDGDRIRVASSTVELPTWHFDVSDGTNVTVDLPGEVLFPAVVIDFGTLALDDLWVELTVDFTIRARYAAAVYFRKPGVMKLFQWKANPL